MNQTAEPNDTRNWDASRFQSPVMSKPRSRAETPTPGDQTGVVEDFDEKQFKTRIERFIEHIGAWFDKLDKEA